MRDKYGEVPSSIRGKNMFITTHSEWIVMGVTHELTKQGGRLRDLRIYEIRRGGRVVEVPVRENGEVGVLETITPVREEYLREIIEGGVLSNERGGNNH